MMRLTRFLRVLIEMKNSCESFDVNYVDDRLTTSYLIINNVGHGRCNYIIIVIVSHLKLSFVLGHDSFLF